MQINISIAAREVRKLKSNVEGARDYHIHDLQYSTVAIHKSGLKCLGGQNVPLMTTDW